MTWLLVLVALAVVAAAFFLGRWTSPSRKRAAAVAKELEGTREELQDVRRRVNGHFEQSGRLFGRLAEDYRALYEHFSETAVQLGFTEIEAERLLEAADRQIPKEDTREVEHEVDDSEEALEDHEELESEAAEEPARAPEPETAEEPLRAREAEA